MEGFGRIGVVTGSVAFDIDADHTDDFFWRFRHAYQVPFVRRLSHLQHTYACSAPALAGPNAEGSSKLLDV